MSKRVEYRVVWKREGCLIKRKKYRGRPTAERFMVLLGPEPWKHETDRRGNPMDPDSRMCCDGHECGCGGETIRDHYLRYREERTLPTLEWMRLETREVEEAPWTSAE